MRLELMVCATLVLAACSATESPPPLLGQSEWARVELLAEASEPLVSITVAQGEQVREGQLLAQMDPTRAGLRLSQALAEEGRAEAALRQALNGARSETVATARAELASLAATRDEARRERQRIESLAQRKLVPDSERDRARATAERAEAAHAAGAARLSELLRGTREEQLAQAEAALAAASALRKQAELDVERLAIRAPRTGRIDALPYEVGDRPVAGSTVVTLLVGESPYARVFVPAPQRTGLQPGQVFDVLIEGSDATVSGRLREIAAEPAFTPYYALTGDDASQLVYRAEISLDAGQTQDLPAGVPLRAIARNGQ